MSTTNKTLNVPANGSNVNMWDVPVNANWNSIDAALGSTTSLNVTSVSGTVNLTLTQYTPPIIKITGTLTANVTYSIPSGVGGFWTAFNNTTGAFTVTFASAGGGTSIVLPQGFSTAVISDGTNIGLWNTASGTAAGAPTQVQFNSSGVLAGSSNLTWNGTALGVKGTVALQGSTSGAIALEAPAIAGATVYILPTTPGSANQFLTTPGGTGTIQLTWTGATGGVTSLSFGTTGLTPSTGTGGAITVGGTLATGSGGTGLGGFTSGGALYATSSSALTSGVLPLTGGGLGVSTTPAKGAIPIGTGAGYTVGTLTAGSGVMITNGAGTVTITATGSGGTVTSVNASGGTTGMTFTGGPITGTGTLTMGGTLAVASGGTGAGTQAGAQSALGVPSTTGSGASGTWGISISGNAATSSSTTGNAATATTLATGRTIAITGDISYTSPSFNGSANVTAAGTLATVNSNVGSFTNASLTVNAKGLVTAASSGATPQAAITYAQFRNQQTSGTGSGETLSATTWNQRVLNTTVLNTIPSCTLGSNQISLPAGTYEVTASGLGLETGAASAAQHKLRIRNITASTTLVAGQNNSIGTTGSGAQSLLGVLQGQFTLAGTATIELDSYPSVAMSGGSTASSGEVEVYCDIYLRKVA